MVSFAAPHLLLPRSNTHRETRTCVVVAPVLCCYGSSDLKRAISDGHLIDFGECISLLPGGVICAPQRKSPPPWNSRHPWKDAIDTSVSFLNSRLKQVLHSVYLRGSVSTGNAFLDGRSDIDLIVLLKSPSKSIPTSVSEIDAQLRAKFPFVRRADIAVHDVNALQQNVRFTLLAYAVHLFGPDIRPTLGCTAPGSGALLDIRALELRAISHKRVAWFLKRCLRGIVDTVSPESLQHARDIVACASILTKTRPEYAALTARAAVAIAFPIHSSTEADTYETCRNMGDWAEVEFLRANFGLHHAPRTSMPPALVQPHLFAAFQRNISNATFALRERLQTHVPVQVRTARKPAPFHRNHLRPIALTHLQNVREVSDVLMDDVFAHYAKCFIEQGERIPVVYRDALPPATKYLCNSDLLVDQLSNSYAPVDVRVAPGPLFTFCRTQHPWYTKRPSFTPPSVVRRMSERNFIQRARTHSEYIQRNLVYPDERVYLQSDVLLPPERLYNLPSNSKSDIHISIAQDERRWVATHGCVSTLHYDCAHSVLAVLTGTKRMVFLPPSLLQYTRPYPEGHPLQRRAMLDITRNDDGVTSMFREFWDRIKTQPAVVQEVGVEVGDVVVFPPLWAHYTESLAEEGQLCAAHTMRFLLNE